MTNPPVPPGTDGDPLWRRLVGGASALEWLYLVVGLSLVVRYRWIFDDSFIYYRYVDNLLFLDAGLTYNAGEFVEGYTSPLHCLLLMPLRALHLGYPAINLIMGLVLFAVFWRLMVELGRALSPAHASVAGLNFPLAFMATNYSVMSFFTGGNETALIHVCAAATALLLVRPGSRTLGVIAALSPLVRPELALSLAITLVWVTWRQKRIPLTLVIASGVTNGGWLLFRIYYYADLLPNTFYLKHGSNFAAGVHYLLDLAVPYGLGFVALAYALLCGWLVQRTAGSGDDTAASLQLAPRAVMLGIAVAIGSYVVRTGGSSMHYYYLAGPLTLAMCSSAGLIESAVDSLGRSRSRAWLAPLARASMCALLLVSFSLYPAKLDRHPISSDSQMIERPSSGVITDPGFFRHRGWGMKHWPDIAAMRDWAPVLRDSGYARWNTSGWCNFIYGRFQQRSVHGWGLTDGVLARVETDEVKRGHKRGLREMAGDIATIQQQASQIDRGMFREAVERGDAPDWVVRNLDVIEIIERKSYNRHAFSENLALALEFPPPIRP